MIIFRITEPKFANEIDILSGMGATGGGRWNPTGQRAIYCGSDSDVCAAEQAFYKIVGSLGDYGACATAKEKKTFSKKWLIDRRLKLIKLELDIPSDKILDISNDDKLKSGLASLSSGMSTTCSELRKSDYHSIPGRKTQVIGQLAYNLGYSGVVAKSARHHGNVITLFPGNINKDKIEVHSPVPIKLSAVTDRGKKLYPGKEAASSKVLLELGASSSVIDILRF